MQGDTDCCLSDGLDEKQPEEKCVLGKSVKEQQNQQSADKLNPNFDLSSASAASIVMLNSADIQDLVLINIPLMQGDTDCCHSEKQAEEKCVLGESVREQQNRQQAATFLNSNLTHRINSEELTVLAHSQVLPLTLSILLIFTVAF